MRLLAPVFSLLLLAGCGPDLLLPHIECCDDDAVRLVRARDMEDGQLLRVLEKPDRIDLSACWREAERRDFVRLIPPRNGKHARLVHDKDVSDKVLERYLAFKRMESGQDDTP